MAEALRASQLSAAVKVLASAFWDYPETVHLLPDERRRSRVLPRYLLSDARDALGFSMLLGAFDGDHLVGAAAWIPPEAYPVSVGRQARQLVDLAPALPWAWRCLREAQRAQKANRTYHRRHPEHFYLRAVGVDPGSQGHGHGASLLTPILDRADEQGVGCFLQTATAGNVRWYEQFGFAVADAYRPTPTWPDTWSMWRPPPLTSAP
jgi:GNAT superfamily N-acetyltransferase